MEDSVKQRLMKFMDYKEISASRFERMCGLSNGYFNKLRNAPGLDKIDKMLRVFPELNREWVLTGEEPMLNEGYTTFDPVGVATPTAPNLENEITLLKAKLEEKEKMIDLLKQQLEELNNLNKGLMTTLTNVATSRTSAKKVAEE
jgi:hypothetical protein